MNSQMNLTQDTNSRNTLGSIKLLYKYCQYLSQVMPQYIEKISIKRNEIVLELNKKYKLSAMSLLYRDINTQLCGFIDLTAVDFLKMQSRFRLIYFLRTFKYNMQFNIYIDNCTFFYTVTDLYKGARWSEREVWDMFGIYTETHLKIRRILTDYTFQGFPLRKDFPLSGFKEIYFSNNLKHMVSQKVEFSQEYRMFELRQRAM